MLEREVILYIAVSLDGYIADRQGGVSWLGGEEKGFQGDYGYAGFARQVDTVVMGRRTYRQIREELSPDSWPYTGMTAYVLTHRPQEEREGIRFVNRSVEALLTELKRQGGRGIWLCGGGEIVRQGLCLVDVFHLSVMPVLLGGGVRLFPEGETMPLRLLSCRHENGVVSAVYRRR